MKKETLELRNKIMMLEIELKTKEAVIESLIDRLRNVRLKNLQEQANLRTRLHHAEIN